MAGGCRVFSRRSPVTDRQDEKKSQAGGDRRQGAVYQGAFEAVFALLIMAGFGYWLDGYFDTAPVLLLIGIALGFASFTLRLIRLGRWMKDGKPGGTDDFEESD